ncbi:MAG: cupin domain-containing protein [Actinomycetota bacterium]
MVESSAALARFPIHLGRDASAVVQPAFSGDLAWYGAYAERAAADGVEGRLVAMHTFSAPWDSWEMHPHGDEVVICTQGSVTLHQEHADGTTDVVTLAAGEAAINPPGTWHTADCDAPVTCVFITAGLGTEHRPR